MLAVAGRVGCGHARCFAKINNLEINFDWTPGDPQTGTREDFDIHSVVDALGNEVMFNHREIEKLLIQYKQKAA
jgi:hypothetical protein